MSCSQDGFDCGVHSSCVGDVCVCDDGFFQEKDFSAVDVNGCAVKVKTVEIMHWVSFCAQILSFIAYAASMKRWSQVRRLIPYYITILSSAAYCITKALNVDTRFVGSDPVLTVFITLHLAMLIPTNHVAASKYIYTQMKLLKHYEPTFTRSTLKWTKVVLYFMTAVSLIASLNVMIFSADGFSDEGRQISMRVALGVFGIGVLVNAGVVIQVNAMIVKDIEKNALQIDDNLRKAIRKIKGVRTTAIPVLIPSGLFLFSGAVSVEVLKLWVYFAPIVLFVLATGTIFVLLFNKGKFGSFSYKSGQSSKTDMVKKTDITNVH